MTQPTKSNSPLRQRMIDDMTLRKLAPGTHTAYIGAVKKLTRFLGASPDSASAEDLRRFQLHLVEQGIASNTLNRRSTDQDTHQIMRRTAQSWRLADCTGRDRVIRRCV